MARKRLLTVEGAVLLHLLDYTNYSPEDTLPLDMTQAGISRALGVRRSHVAQSLDTAISQGKVEENLSRVKGEKRKRKCYFLTHVGIGLAKTLRETVLTAEVRSELPEGLEFKGTLSDLLEKLGKGQKLPALALLVAEGCVGLPQPDAGAEGSVQVSGIPTVGRFFGRGAELQKVRSLISGNIRILGLTGMPGIGKTALMAHALGGTGNVFWYRVPDWSGPRHAAVHLAAFLGRVGSNRMRRYLEVHEVPDLGDMHDILICENLSLLMVFDDCQKAGNSMQAFLGMLARACSCSESLKMCMLGRGLPDADGLFSVPGLNSVATVTLGPLDKESSMEILRARGMPEAKARAIADKGAGHPLFLNLADEAGSGNVIEMLAREIQATLSDAENRMMLQMSVYRQPVATEALAETEEDIVALDSLADRSLLMHAGGWSMHSLLREFFYSRQPSTSRETRHERAAEYYARHDRTTCGQVEEMYQLFMARDFESAIMGLAETGTTILAQGYTDEILALCAMVPEGWQNSDEIFRVDLLKATALDLVGLWDEASGIYRTCKEMARETGDAEREAGALRRLGAIEYRKGNLAVAGKLLKTALGMLEPGSLQAEVQGSLGVVQWKLGDIDAAAKSHASDLAISEAGNDLRGISRALNNLGILDWQTGHNTAALEKYSRALACAEKIHDSRLVAILYSNMGDVHRTIGNFADARRYYGRCLALAEDLRFHWQTAEAYRGLAEVVPEKRQDYLSRALTIFERLGAVGDAKTVREMMT